MAVPSILQDILDRKAEEVAAGKAVMSTAELTARASARPATRGFERGLRRALQQGPAIIAEIKKASPSAGVICEDFHPNVIAWSYAEAGAACLSVLTDKDFFQGHYQYLEQARNACALPVLRKDFMLDPWQILESRVLGADCILLIAAVLEQSRLQDLLGLARELGMDALVEVHDEAELERALESGADIVGINNRNLKDLSIDLAVTERLAARIPEGVVKISESGVETRSDIKRLGAHADAVATDGAADAGRVAVGGARPAGL